MPSSKNRSTHLERHLNRLHRETALRLHTAYQPQINTYLLPYWCQILDSSHLDLAAIADQYWRPAYNEAYHIDKEEWEDEVKKWKQWVVKVRAAKANQNCWDAAECLFDVGRCLELVGRGEEGREWGRLAEELRAYAESMG